MLLLLFSNQTPGPPIPPDPYIPPGGGGSGLGSGISLSEKVRQLKARRLEDQIDREDDEILAIILAIYESRDRCY